jgi:hypothetical protein
MLRKWFILAIAIAAASFAGCGGNPDPNDNPDPNGNDIVDNPPTVNSYVHTTPDGRPITVNYVLPPNINNETKVMFSMAGVQRTPNPPLFRPLSIIANYVVIAPEFSQANFPNAEYQTINIAGNISDYSKWSFHHIDRIFEEIVQQFGLSCNSYILYGFSAGSQFTHRTLMFSKSPYLNYGIAADAGTYTFLNEDWNYSRGIKNLLSLKSDLLHSLANKKLYILIGSDDNDPNAEYLDHGDYDVQGLNRYERAMNFYAAAEDYASQNGVISNWELTVMPGVAHNSTRAVPFLLDIITGNNYFRQPDAARTPIQLSGQGRLYGTWYSGTSNNATIITSNNVTVVQNERHLVARIESIEPVTNTNAATRDRFPEGYRIRGVYTESNQSGTPVGSAYNRVWYISADNRTLNRSDSTTNVWNRY